VAICEDLFDRRHRKLRSVPVNSGRSVPGNVAQSTARAPAEGVLAPNSDGAFSDFSAAKAIGGRGAESRSHKFRAHVPARPHVAVAATEREKRIFAPRIQRYREPLAIPEAESQIQAGAPARAATATGASDAPSRGNAQTGGLSSILDHPARIVRDSRSRGKLSFYFSWTAASRLTCLNSSGQYEINRTTLHCERSTSHSIFE
jgi:hypothetical protein